MINNTISLEYIEYSNNPNFWIIVGVAISFIILIIMILTLRKTNQIQRQNIFHDLIKRESELWEKKEEIGGRIGIEKVLNFYEYMSFLYFERIISKKMAKKMFKNELIKNYENYERHVKKDFENLIKLYKRWKKEESESSK